MCACLEDRPIYHPLRVILVTDGVRHARRKLLGTRRAWLWEEHRMCQLDIARIQFGTTLWNRRWSAPVSIGLGGSASLGNGPVWDRAATAGAEAVRAAPR